MFLMSMKVFPFSLFKLLKFIIVSFHLALILFVLKIVLVYFCSYIFIWFEYTVNRVCKSLKLIQTVVDTELVSFSRNQKCCYPEVFSLIHFSRVMCEIVAKKKTKKVKCIFTWYIWLLLGFAVVVGRCACVNLL